MTSTGVSKVLLKLRQNIQDGNSYEAFQMYHSISQRHLKKKEFNLAIELLNDGAKTMIQCGQHGSAIDLSHRLLDIYDLELKLCDIAREKIMDLFELFFETPKFCEQYTQQVDAVNYNIFLELDITKVWLTNIEGLYYDAERYYILGTQDSASMLGLMEFEFAGQGYHKDFGYFLARGVLPLLLAGKEAEADLCFDAFSQKLHPGSILNSTKDYILTEFPLFNMVQVIIKMIKSGDGSNYNSLLNQFQNELSFDDYLEQCCESIGKQYFKIGVKEVTPNPLADIFKSMMNNQSSGSARKQLEISEDADMD